MNIAIIGCGFAGLASSLFLSEKENVKITIFEKFSEVKAVGAGVTIQPSGMYVLEKLGLYEDLLKHGEKIYDLYGTNHKGCHVFHTKYADYERQGFGIGIHRSILFDLLYQKALTKNNIEIILNSEIKDIDSLSPKYDLVIIANGTNSELRKALPIKQSCHVYPYGCIWTTIEDDLAVPHQLQQYVKYSQEMFGILPSGVRNSKRTLSVFWSLPIKEKDTYSKENVLSNMKKYNISSDIMKKIENANFTFASYNEVWMKQYHHKNMVVIGDAAHGMSPQLGQGINMGLIDAYILSQCLDLNNINKSLECYTTIRKPHLNFYRQASKFLTPLFQSDNWQYGLIRDCLFTVSQKLSFSRVMSSHILYGKRVSWLSKKELNLD